MKDVRAMEQQPYSGWYQGKSLTTDWTSGHLSLWAKLFAARRNEPLAVLEIGSWEGRSAIFFLRYFHNSRITCIDTFAGSAEHLETPSWTIELPHIEARFDSNLAEFGDRVEKLKDTSRSALARLGADERRFDLIFIDGSHHSADAQSDAVLSWPLLRERGIMIFDDYEWDLRASDIERPKLGVDNFLQDRRSEYRELHRGYQLIVEKTAP